MPVVRLLHFAVDDGIPVELGDGLLNHGRVMTAGAQTERRSFFLTVRNLQVAALS
jgi:hypothetical protein